MPSDGVSLPSCMQSLAGKQHKIAFKICHTAKKSNVLDLVNTNMCSIGDRTLGGTLYFVTFMDNHCKKLQAYAFKINDQVLEVFKYFLAKVEREKGQK